MLSERLKRVRLNAGLSQQQFGEIINVKKTTVSMYESGERTPSIETLSTISKEFHVPLSYLINGENEEELSPKRKELLTLLQSLSEEEAEAVRSVVAAMRANKK